MRDVLRTRPFGFALVLSLVLLAANIIAEPSFGDPSNWPQELASFAPFAIVAMASTPSILSGGGGLDLSVGPLAVTCASLCLFVRARRDGDRDATIGAVTVAAACCLGWLPVAFARQRHVLQRRRLPRLL